MPKITVLFLFFFLISGWTTSPAWGAENSIFPLADGVPVQLKFNQTTVTASGPGENALDAVMPPPDQVMPVDLTQVRSFLDRLDQDMSNSLPELSLSKLFEDIKSGKLNLSPDQLGKSLLALLGREILTSGPLMGKLLILAILCAVLQQLQSAFEGSVAKVARMLTYLVLLGLALATFQTAIDAAKGAIDQMVGLMQASMPVMFTLLFAMGHLTTAALFKPVVIGSLTLLATIIKNVILPLFFLSAVLRLVNQISDQFKLSKLAGLFDFAGKTGIGLVLTVFIGVMAIQGATGGVADGVALRTAKYSADAIPVVGKFFKDAVELVVSSGILLRNAVGIIALIALALICMAPVIKIVALIFAFRLTAALIEPIGEKSLADSLQDMAKSLTMVFWGLGSVAIMFFMAVAIIIGSGNMTVMLR